MQIFTLHSTNCPFDMQLRVSDEHYVAHQGVVHHDTIEKQHRISASGDIYVDMVGKLVVSRSGIVLPQVFMPSVTRMIVSENVRTQLEALFPFPFLDVRFNKLVDLPMPALGDESWYHRVIYPPGPEVELEVTERTDVPEYHVVAGNYCLLGCPVINKVTHALPDVEEVDLNFGSYFLQPSAKALMSKKLLEQWPIFYCYGFHVREDAFRILAPHIDRDFIGVAWNSLGDNA